MRFELKKIKPFLLSFLVAFLATFVAKFIDSGWALFLGVLVYLGAGLMVIVLPFFLLKSLVLILRKQRETNFLSHLQRCVGVVVGIFIASLATEASLKYICDFPANLDEAGLALDRDLEAYHESYGRYPAELSDLDQVLISKSCLGVAKHPYLNLDYKNDGFSFSITRDVFGAPWDQWLWDRDKKTWIYQDF